MTVQELFTGESALVPGALRGYRTWESVEPITGRLHSTGIVYHWWREAPFGGAREDAVCRVATFWPVEEHQAPVADCTCGLYAWYDPADHRIPLGGCTGPVFGVVQATGRVILGTHGMRAEHLEVVAITAEDPAQRALLRRFGYPTWDSADEMLAAYPPEDVSELVQHECDGQCTWRASSLSQVWIWATSGAVQMSTDLGKTWHSVMAGITAAANGFVVTAGALNAQSKRIAEQAKENERKLREQGPMHGPLTVAQAALEQRRSRHTGPSAPSLFRAALKRRGR